MRALNAALKLYLDSKMGPFFNDCHPINLMLFAAETLIGTTEADNPAMVDMIRNTLCKPWGEPWCVDFIQTCVVYAEIRAGVRSALFASESVLRTWEGSKATLSVPAPQIGDMIVWRMGNTQEGHCGIITAIDSLVYETIEGNTSDSADIDRNGRGVFAKKRAKGGTRTFTEVGFLRCFP